MAGFATNFPDDAPIMAPFVVRVFHDPETRCWIAVNDEIPIATEAETLDALVERVWSIAPELAQLNGMGDDIRLRFVLDTQPASA